MAMPSGPKKVAKILSLSDEYWNFMWLIFRGALILSCITLYYSFTAYKKEINDEILRNSNVVEHMLEALIEKNHRTMTLIGQRISHGNFDNLYYIADTLQQTAHIDYEENHYRTTILWSSADNKILVSSFKGIHETPMNALQFNGYATPWDTMINPDVKISLFLPNIPMMHLILAVHRDTNGLLGRVEVGIDLIQFSRRIRKKLLNEGIVFLVLNKKNQVVSASEEYEKLIGTELDVLKQDITKIFTNTKHYTLHSVDNLPFNVFVGKKSGFILGNFMSFVFPHIVEILLFSVLCLLLLYGYRQKIIKPIVVLSNYAFRISEGCHKREIPTQKSYELQSLAGALGRVWNYLHNARKSELAIKKFHTEILAKRKDNFQEILRYNDVILKLLETVNFKAVVYIKLKKTIETLSENIVKLEESIFNVCDVSSTDINELILDVMDIHASVCHKSDVNIVPNFSNNIPDVFVDCIALKYVFFQLLWGSIVSTPGGKIEIKTFYAENSLSISIIDNGFGLSDAAMQRMLGNTEVENPLYMHTDINMGKVKDIISLNGGEIFSNIEPGKGRKTIVIFPVCVPDSSKKTTESNVVYLQNNKM